jgi:hypothetical protein
MTALRAIDPKPFAVLAGALPAIEPGMAPQLRWIEIEKLAVDPAYQREIGKTGQKNIIRIACEFEWARFSPVIVAPSKERFVVIDGQHRTTAAALRGHKKVPCQIISADQRKQAAAFAAINAVVTAMSPMQLHAAKLAAGDEEACRLHQICEECGAVVLRYPIKHAEQKVGETMASGALYQALKLYGEPALRAALTSVTRTRDGNPGLLNYLTIRGLGMAFAAEPRWCTDRRLLGVMERFDLRASQEAAFHQAKGGSNRGAQGILSEMVLAHLRGTDAIPAVPQKSASDDAEKRDIAPTSNGTNVKPITFNGVTVDSTGAICFKNRKLKALPREALFIGHLARGFGSPIDLDFLIKRVWARSAVPKDPDSALNMMSTALAPRLAEIGLELKVVKGVGIVLRAAR